MGAESIVKRLVSTADIEINGSRPWDIQVHNPAMYERVLRQGSLGFGESYMDGEWDSEDLETTIVKILQSGGERQISRQPLLAARLAGFYLSQVIPNRGARRRAYEIGKHHYDIGNELYRRMLDRRMIYSCGYWRNASDLNEAQEAKLDLICRKLGLEPGMRVLDIGCGWGGFLKYAAEHYGIQGLGVTVSEQQANLARESVRELPLEIRLCDYRDVEGTFDRILSIGMFEHVGVKNYPAYMQVVNERLVKGGLHLLHTIGNNKPIRSRDRWVARYIFPNSKLPALCQIDPAAREHFILEDMHNFGPDYTKTLRAWHENFTAAWPELAQSYDERFRRMWVYFLLSCAASFRTRNTQLWQLIYSRDREETYHSVR